MFLHYPLMTFRILMVFFLFMSQMTLAVPPTDNIAAWGGGGVLEECPPGLVLDEMELNVSATLITCRKVLRNESAEDISLKMAFHVPQPPIRGQGHQSYWDEDVIEAKEYNHDRAGSWTMDKMDMKKVPFLNFSVKVDGRPVVAQHKIVTLKEGADVTPLMTKHNLPLSPDVAACRNLPLINFDQAECKTRIRKLQTLHLADSYGQPLWKKNVQFTWDQSFPAGQQVVGEYSYHPATGFLSVHFDDERPPLESLAVGLLHTGCFLSNASLNERTGLEYDITNWLLKKFSDDLQTPENNKGTYLYEVSYLLATEGQSKRPIKSFKLLVEHPEGGTVQASPLWTDMIFKRISPTQVEATRSNFIPRSNLSVIIASPALITDVF